MRARHIVSMRCLSLLVDRDVTGMDRDDDSVITFVSSDFNLQDMVHEIKTLAALKRASEPDSSGEEQLEDEREEITK